MACHCPWKMCATPGACIKSGCLARRPLCHKVNLPSCVARRPLCHRVNLPRYEARRRHFIMNCYIYGTEINKLNENTEKVNEVSRTHIPLKAFMNDSLENCEIEKCNVSEPLNAYVCKESRRDKYKITKQRRHRRIRDREPSRIPVRRVLRKLKKRTTRHRLKCCVLNNFPCTSFINCLCKNYKNWFLWYNTEHCYFKYMSFMMVYKCKSTYPNGCSYRNVYSSISHTKSVVRHLDISDNGSTLKGGLLSKNSSCKSAWACL